MARTTLTALLLMALSLPATALAQADKVWIDCRHGESFGCPYEDQLQDFQDAMLDAGASEVVISTELPSNVADGDFKLLVMIMPTLDLGKPELQMIIPGFLAGGGRLVLLGDNSSEWGPNGIIEDILESIPGHDLAFGDVEVNPGCDQSTNLIQGDPLTAGLDTWHFNQVNTDTGGDALIRFDRSDTGGEAVLGAVARLPTGGEVILFGDIEGFVMHCATVDPVEYDWWNDHGPFWSNLFTDGSSAPDSDADGWDADEDCNDDDPYVHPGADEVCDNEVDDDCDGDVDGDDTDCDTGDDDDVDDDDDDVSDDDDVVLDDDDAGWGDDDWGGGCCAQTVVASRLGGSASVLLVALIGLAGVRRRRDR